MKKILILILFFTLGIKSVFSDKLVTTKKNILKNVDLKKYGLKQLIILKNSYYAKYGYIFKKPWLQKYFDNQKWY